jgi:glycerate 2-kinase
VAKVSLKFLRPPPAARPGFGLVRAAQIPVAARDQLTGTERAEGSVAIIEMAAASGLGLLTPPQRDVWETSTVGTGELIAAAAARGASAIVLGVGGSATNDLGVGALRALGLQFQAETGGTIDAPAPATWPRINRISGQLRPLPPIFIACDVTNPLLGAHGAAAVYGPQKGLRAEDILRLDHQTARMALLLSGYFGQPDEMMDLPGSGAAGGIAFGLTVAAGARLLPGFDFVARWLDLEARIAAADLVLTGEGRFDDSSLDGKGPGAVAACALALGKPVHVFAGQCRVSRDVAPGLSLHAITPAETPLREALARAPEFLGIAVRAVFERSLV